ncbi:MAG: YeeE/YedE family protein [Mogibacterium sp.]|nr:YeeE/YedE family protein [Mogibacterium sp.]
MGILLGYVLSRSGICFTGLVRDIYLLGYRYNIVLFLTMISIQGLIYYLLGITGLIRIPSYLPPFSLLTIAVGSFAFGFGAVMANGCLTATLVKCGDGRLSGWIYLAVFMATGYFFAAGHGIGLSKAARSVAVVNDALAVRTTPVPAAVFAVTTAILVYLMYRSRRGGSPSGRRWALETGPVLMGILLGLAYLVSEQTGRHFGVALSTPVMSWIYMFTHPVETCGGCNPYDEHFGWGSMLVLGIVLGSFVTSKISGEFRIVKPHKSEILRGIIGAALMGFGAMWGLGCLLGNGIVGTAQFSLKSWYALVFLVAGIWTSTRIWYAPMLKD